MVRPAPSQVPLGENEVSQVSQAIPIIQIIQIIQIIAEIISIGDEPPAKAALAWLLSLPQVVVIARRDQPRAAPAPLGSWVSVSR